MSIDISKWDQDQRNMRVQNGWAGPGELVVGGRAERVYKIVNARTKRYLVVDEDGKEWTVPFGIVRAAPEGTVFSGPEKSANTIKREQREKAALAFGPGDLVEFARPEDQRKFPGTYVIVRRTNATRFSLQEVGGHKKCTAPASILRWAR